MTPEALRRMLHDLPGSWPPVSEPALLLRAVEDAADHEPANRYLAAAVRHAHDLVTVDANLPHLVGGVRRDGLVRWDAWTTTWTGTDISTGAGTMLRVLRPALAKDPVARRSLRRDARALGPLDSGVMWVEQPLPGLRRPLGGVPFDTYATEDADAGTLVRLLATGLAGLRLWESAGMATPGLGPDEWRLADGRLSIACLTPGGAGHTVRPDIRDLATALASWWGDRGQTAVDTEIAGFATFPPESAEDAVDQVRRAMATALTRTRHHLARARSVLQVRSEHHRLLDVLVRLQGAVAPPPGVGAVGVDLDGRVRSVRSDGHIVVWGAHGDEGEAIRGADGKLSPSEARRLLRARAAAPPNPRLQESVDGSEAFTEAICRWVASAHHLRTMVLLVQKTA